MDINTEKVAFTICANNYLAYALTLCQSFKNFHPNVPFYVLLVDKPTQKIDYNSLDFDGIMWVDDLSVDIIDLAGKYNIAELCTVVKPVTIMKFFDQGFTNVIYLDPDIQVFSEFKELFEQLPQHDMVITPHICSPTPEGIIPNDHTLMRTGVYNLGFAAFNKTKKTQDFLNWWDERVQSSGYHDVQRGFFFDQIWVMWAPAFLDSVYILRHLGYNAANWNLFERHFSSTNDENYIINSKWDLRFFHYSHFKPEKFPELASYNKSFDANNRPDVYDLFSNYIKANEDNGHSELRKIPFVYGKVFMDNAEAAKKGKKVENIKVKRSRISAAASHVKQSLKIILKGE